MDKKQAQTIIKETFESPFDKNKFIGFVKNLLNDVEEATFIYKGNYIPDAYEQYISTLERIGKYSDGEYKIDILIAKLKKETSIERARTMQRNFVAWYLNGSRGGEMKDAALVAFVAPDEQDWRFSLVKMDYRFEEGKKGRMRVKEEFTPARRWSFLVGANENSHTAQSQLVDLVADDERNPALAQLEEAFNIEKVTKEFFEKYRELFLWTHETLEGIVKKDKKIKADFEDKKVNTIDFSKKLLGQIVFLYFLQKKGWFGVKRDADWGTGPKGFLRELFESKHGSYKNFFNDILEPLFYEALRIDRSHDDDYYSKLNCRIPFLNGGLFDPINNYDWVHTDILLPNDLFSNDYKTKEGDKGNGILDIFDRYNFTVKEDEPLEKEVAVDPEMLGKVFENLLEVKDRKSKGTYYTPREIVHYMCQQSVINYVATELEGKVSKEDIETLVKHGEHLGENETTVEAKGRETNTYFYKLPEGIRQNAELIDKKLIDIKVCDPAIGSGAFPVGMMGEIVKTRNVLTAYIKGKDRTIYNFKRECIEKSLYGIDIDPGAVEIAKLRLWLSLVVDEDDIEQIKPLPNLDYKIICGNSLLGVEKDLFNSHLFSELERLKPLLFNEINPKKKQEYKKQIDELIVQITHGHKEFDFEVYFSEVFHGKKGFNVVIANPPYEVLKGFKERPYLKKEIEIYKSTFFYSIQGNINLYKLFCEKAHTILKENGVFCFIMPMSIISDGSSSKLRNLWLTKNKIVSVSIYPEKEKIFENVTQALAIVIFLKSGETSTFNVILNTAEKKQISCLSLDIIRTIDDEQCPILFLSKNELSILKKIRSSNRLFSEFIRGYEGECHQTFHKAFFKDHDTGSLLVRGINVNKWQVDLSTDNKHQRWIDKRGFLKSKGSSDTARHYLEERIIQQGIANMGQEVRLKATILQPEIFCGNSVNYFLINGEYKKNIDVKFILALLNSRLLNWRFKITSSNNNINCYEIHRLAFPNIKNLPKDQKPFVDVVDKILAITKNSDCLQNATKQAKVKEYEHQINQMVYELYGLTKEDIKIVEGHSKEN